MGWRAKSSGWIKLSAYVRYVRLCFGDIYCKRGLGHSSGGLNVGGNRRAALMVTEDHGMPGASG